MSGIVPPNCGAIVEVRWPDCGTTGPQSARSTLSVIRLNYKIDSIARDPESASERSLRPKNTANRPEFVIYIRTKRNVANSEFHEFLGRSSSWAGEGMTGPNGASRTQLLAAARSTSPSARSDPRSCFEAVRWVRPERAILPVC